MIATRGADIAFTIHATLKQKMEEIIIIRGIFISQEETDMIADEDEIRT